MSKTVFKGCETHPDGAVRTVQYRTFCVPCDTIRKRKYRKPAVRTPQQRAAERERYAWRSAYEFYLLWCQTQGL